MVFIRKADVLAQIKQLGMVCRYDSDNAEYRIDYRRTDSRWNEDSAYYTTYPDDAIETAKVMAQAGK